MKLIKAVNVQHSSVETYDRATLEDFQQYRVSVDEVLAEEAAPEEEPIDLEALRLEVLAQAREEAAGLIQQAYDEGLRRGEEAGRAAFDLRISGVAELLEQAARDMHAAREEFLDSLEPQVMELVALVARRTLQRELATDPALISATVRRALGKLGDRQRLVARLHPDDAVIMRDERAALLENFVGIEELHLVIDDTLARGCCVIDSTTMQVDARLDALLDEVLAELWR